MKSLKIPAEVNTLDDLNLFLDAQMEACGCPDAAQFQIRLAVEEVFVNISSYAYLPETGMAEICFDCLDNPRRVEICFIDNGTPFNPLDKEDSDTSEDAIIEREGGMGILLVKNLMDDVRYQYEDGQNKLTIVKNL